VAVGGFWILTAGTVVAHFFWLTGVAAGAEEDAGAPGLRILRGLLFAVLMLEGVTVVPVAVAALVRAFRGALGEVADPARP
jgi:hypothetical protein